jgi:cation:H+ antiporter
MWELLLLVLGIAFLVKGADFLIDGSTSLAKRLGVSTLVIGLTVVAFGTSLPELVVNIVAAIHGSGDIALGNIIGSNMSNILLILGITAALTTVKVAPSTTWKEIPFAILAVLVLLTFSLAPKLDMTSSTLFRFEGIILLLFFCIFLYYVIELAKNTKTKENIAVKTLPAWKTWSYIIGGLALLYFGGQWTVIGAVFIAKLAGLSEYVISSTIIAVGTSLPELITSVMAALRKEPNLAIGNIVGSNIFNIFFILGLTAVLMPLTLTAQVITDSLILLFTTVLLFVFLAGFKQHQLERWQGIVFLLLYAGYVTFLLVRFL